MLASFQCQMPLHHLFEVEDIDHLLEWKLDIVTLLQIKEFVKLFTIIITNIPIMQAFKKFSMRSLTHDGQCEKNSGQCEKERNGGRRKNLAVSLSTLKGKNGK